MSAVAEIRGTVTVLEAGANYQLIEVVSATTAVALLANPAQEWRSEQCYSVTYFDPDTTPDGTLSGEPSLLRAQECAP